MENETKHGQLMFKVLKLHTLLIVLLDSPGLSMPVSEIGPSSSILLTKIWPAAFFTVHPIPFWGSLNNVTLLIPEEKDI